MSLARHAKKRDLNEAGIVKALRAIPGCTVETIDRPVDLLVGYRGHTYLIEVKNRDGRNRTTKGQDEFLSKWTGGQPCIVYDADEALRFIGARR